MIFIGRITRKILARIHTFPVPDRIWKFICERKLKIRKKAEYLRIVPEMANFSVKRRTLSFSQNSKKNTEVQSAIIEK